jgi:hypothetical protein
MGNYYEEIYFCIAGNIYIQLERYRVLFLIVPYSPNTYSIKIIIEQINIKNQGGNIKIRLIFIKSSLNLVKNIIY